MALAKLVELSSFLLQPTARNMIVPHTAALQNVFQME
jgi:hypothetical protein